MLDLQKEGTLCIIGASMGGSLAAYALAPFFKSVTVLEQSKTLGENRKGLGQALQFHVFLTKGQSILERIIPGVSEDFKRHQCPTMRLPTDIHWTTDFGAMNPKVNPWAKIYMMDRLTLERVLIERLLKDHPNVTIKLGSNFKNFAINKDENKINGVFYKQAQEELKFLKSDLCIVAGGRSFPLDQLLADHQIHLAPKRFVAADFYYVSILLQNKQKFDWKIRYKQWNPPHSFRGAVLAQVHEEGKYILMVGGTRNHHPKGDLDSVKEFLTHFSDPTFLEVLNKSEILIPPSVYRIDGSRHSPFGESKNWPRSLIAVGDTVCAFNPVYGQGLSVASIEVEILKQIFHKGEQRLKNWEQKFQKQVDKIIQEPWLMATGEDSRLNGSESGWFSRFCGWYMQQYLKAAVQNASMAVDFGKVSHMVKSPKTLFKPQYLFHILRRKI